MKIQSPVGNFPFDIKRIRFHRRGLVVNASMGAWPATLDASYGDVLAIAGRLLRVAMTREGER